MKRRTFLGVCAALVGAKALGEISGCGRPVIEVIVDPADSGFSVYQATSREHLLLIDSRTSWQNSALAGLRQVVAIDDLPSKWLVFEVNGRRYDGRADAAELTVVFAGDRIIWREA